MKGFKERNYQNMLRLPMYFFHNLMNISIKVLILLLPFYSCGLRSFKKYNYNLASHSYASELGTKPKESSVRAQ